MPRRHGQARAKQNDPNGSRTRVCAVKGRRPRPLDDGVIRSRYCGVGKIVLLLCQSRSIGQGGRLLNSQDDLCVPNYPPSLLDYI